MLECRSNTYFLLWHEINTFLLKVTIMNIRRKDERKDEDKTQDRRKLMLA